MNEVEQRLREIDERVSKATPPPWVWRGKSSTLHTLHDKGEYQYGRTVLAPTYDYDGGTELEMSEADAEFIAHAREDIPFLLALLREREEENRRLREALAEIRDYAAPRSDLSVYVEIMYEMASGALRGEQP